MLSFGQNISRMKRYTQKAVKYVLIFHFKSSFKWMKIQFIVNIFQKLSPVVRLVASLVARIMCMVHGCAKSFQYFLNSCKCYHFIQNDITNLTIYASSKLLLISSVASPTIYSRYAKFSCSLCENNQFLKIWIVIII